MLILIRHQDEYNVGRTELNCTELRAHHHDDGRAISSDTDKRVSVLDIDYLPSVGTHLAAAGCVVVVSLQMLLHTHCDEQRPREQSRNLDANDDEFSNLRSLVVRTGVKTSNERTTSISIPTEWLVIPEA